MQITKMKLPSSKLLALLTLASTLLLAACGDPTATPVPAPTPVPPTALPATATTVPATATAVPPTATSVPATTVAPTAVPTKAPTTAPATTVAAGNSASLTLPVVSGATELVLDPAITAELTQQLPGAVLKLYASNDDPTLLAANVDIAVTQAGYKFAIPGATKPVKGDNESYVGVYTKAGAADLVIITSLVPKDANELTKELNVPGVDPAAAQKLVDQLKTKKSAMFVIADPSGLLSQLIAGFAGLGSDTPSATITTAAAGATTPASTKPLAVDESVLKVYSGAKRLDSSPGKVGNQLTVYYLSSDKFETITDWAKDAYDPFADDKDVTSSVFSSSGFSGNLQVTTDKYKLKMTFIGPNSRTNPDYKDFVAAAKPGADETLIVAVLSPPSN